LIVKKVDVVFRVYDEYCSISIDKEKPSVELTTLGHFTGNSMGGAMTGDEWFLRPIEAEEKENCFPSITRI